VQRIIFYICLPFLIISCSSSQPQDIYTVSSIQPKKDGSTEYLMVSEKGNKLIIRKKDALLWKLGKKIYLEGELSK